MFLFRGFCYTRTRRPLAYRLIGSPHFAHSFIYNNTFLYGDQIFLGRKYPRLLSTSKPLHSTFLTNEGHKNSADVFLDGDRLCSEGKFEEALVEYSKLVLINPYDPRFTIKKASTLQQLNRFQEAIDEYKKVLYLASESAPTLTAIGVCQVKMGKLPAALKTLNEALFIDSKYVPALLQRSHIHMESGSIQEAILDMERARKIDPENIDYLLELAQFKMNLGKIEEANSLYDEVLVINPQNKSANIGKGIIAYMEGKFSPAVSFFTKSLGDQRDNADVLIKRASALCNLHNFEAAEKDIQDALVLESSNPNAFMIRGQIHVHNKNYEAAIQDLTKFINDCEKSYGKATPSPEEIVLRDHQKATLLEKIGDCYIELFWHSHQKLKKKFQKLTPGEEMVDETFVHDLKKRLDIAKEKHLMGAFLEYTKARSNLLQAKNTIDPKLNKLKLTVNEFLRE